jgi:hypothetical protein
MESGLTFNQLICEFESRHPCHDMKVARLTPAIFLLPSRISNCKTLQPFLTIEPPSIDENRSSNTD